MRSMITPQPIGPWRCCTAISTLWQITQRLTTRIHPSVCGMGSWAIAARPAAPAATAPAKIARAAATLRLRNVDFDRVDHVPAIAERVVCPRNGLDAAETVGGARHQRVAACRRVPVEFPFPP